jgi:hypothetical protein
MDYRSGAGRPCAAVAEYWSLRTSLEASKAPLPGARGSFGPAQQSIVRRRPNVGPQNKLVTRERPGLNRAKSRGNDEQEAHRGRRDEYSLHDVHGSPLTPTITIRPKAHDVCKKDLIDQRQWTAAICAFTNWFANSRCPAARA